MITQHESLPAQLGRIQGGDDEIDAERMRREVHARLFGDEPEPIRIERFVVMRRLGAGGMGVVFAAYDPTLDRRVAIKLVRTREGGTEARLQQRLLREARALARLSHPNVIAVFEVGTHEDDVFIAMELVDGDTLEAFAKAPGRSRRAILDAYLQAGAGLAAAHESALVHRDFKPQNVLVGRDGRVRVLDFGLARVGDRVDDEVTEGDSEPPRSEVLTDADGILGTPAYMAPEQRLGLPATTASDQFAFCASLHEALTGSLPRAVLPDRAAILARAGLSRRTRRVIMRGLAFAPDARWPSMHAVLHELRKDLGHRRLLLAGLGLAGVAAAASIVAMREDACPDAWPRLHGVWDPERKAAVETAVRWDDSEAASEAARLTAQHLDTYAQGWVDAQHRVCEAHRVQHAESAALFDRKMVCLARRRDAMAALGDVLIEADDAVARKAVEAALALTPVVACEDNERLLAEVAPPEDPTTAEAVEHVRSTLQRQRVLLDLGALQDARVLAETAVAQADELAYRPLQAEAAHALGKNLGLLSEAEAASKALRDAVWYAEAGRHDEVVAVALADLVTMDANRDAPENALEAATRARAAIERLGRVWPAEHALETGLGVLARRQDRFTDDQQHARRALDLAREHAPGSLLEGASTNNLGVAAYGLGDYDRAHELLEAALEIQRRWLGALHPHVVNTTTNLASVDERRGDAAAAERRLREAIDAAERAGLAMQLGRALTNLANLRRNQGRGNDALEPAQRAVQVMEDLVGPDGVDMIDLRTNLGAVYGSIGRDVDARAQFERVERIARAAGGRETDLAMILHNLADLDLSEGHGALAESRVTEAIRVMASHTGDDHPNPAQMHIVLALALLAQGRAAEALAAAERSVTVLRRASGSHPALPRAEFTRAKAQSALGDVEQALAAAEAALSALAAGLADETLDAEIRAWMRALEESRDRSGGADVVRGK